MNKSFIHLLHCNVIGQKLQAMVQVIVIRLGFMAVNHPSTRVQAEGEVDLCCHKSMATGL